MIALEARHAEALQKTLDRLRRDVADLRSSRKRLVLAADADRRRIEQELHDSVQQHLVSLAVNLQLMGALVDADRPAAKALLEEIAGHVDQAMGETAELAERIYPPLLEIGGLAAALRAAAVHAGVRAGVEVTAGASYPPEYARTVYLCWLEALEHPGTETRTTVTVREDDGALTFEIVKDSRQSAAAELERLRDRVEALGGRLTILPEPDGRTRVSGSLPLRDEASHSHRGTGSPP